MGYNNNKRIRYDNYTGGMTRYGADAMARSGYSRQSSRGGSLTSGERQVFKLLADAVASTQGGSSATTTSSKKDTSGQGITLQRDSAMIYKRKPAPRGLRQKVKRSYNDFKSKVLKMKGHRQMITNQSVAVASVTLAQSVSSFVLYGGRLDSVAGVAPAAVARGYDDMNDLRKRDVMIGDATGDLATNGRFAPGDVKWFTKTGIMDLTIQNTSGLTAGAVPIAIELDVYEFSCRKPSIAGGTVPNDVESFIQAYNQDTYLPGVSTGVSPGMQLLTQDNRGCTPFEFGGAMAKFGMKIWKKTKYFIPNGDVITYQMRDSKIRQFNHAVFRDNNPLTNHTRGVYIVCKPVPQQVAEIASYICGVTRKYKYVVDSSAVDRSGKWDPTAT